MKKLALTSLLAVFAVPAAHAAIIDGNPLYRPDAGHFYSETALESSTHSTNAYALGEEFGYGITDRMSVALGTSVSTADWFDSNSWDFFGLGVNYRFWDQGPWKADLYGSYGVGPVWGDHASFLDEDDTGYEWLAGVRAGFMGHGWTVAGHIEYAYENTESFNWDEDGWHYLALGLDGQLHLTRAWNLTAGVEYNTMLDHYSDKNGYWTAKLGANYNIDANKYVGAYVEKLMTHEAHGDWEVQDGFGFGVKFGIDF